MLGQRRGRWHNIKLAPNQQILFVVWLIVFITRYKLDVVGFNCSCICHLIIFLLQSRLFCVATFHNCMSVDVLSYSLQAAATAQGEILVR